MHKKYEIEFSKIYKRLMALEIIIKNKAINSIISVHGDDCLNQFLNFFNGKEIKKHYSNIKENKIDKILKYTLSDREKFKKLIKLIYLNDILKLILTYKQFCNDDIARLFYAKKPQNRESFEILKTSRFDIRDLRNDIAHYNFERYEQNKPKYLKTLMLFEIHLGSAIAILHEIPEFDKKPCIKDILLKIKELRPELFEPQEDQEYHYNKDRILIDLFDDLAVINNWQYNELPSPWSILRQKYDMKKYSCLSPVKLTNYGPKSQN